MKYYKPIGILICLLIIVSCFMPWAYYPDLQKSFTGFHSEQNSYGKPGVLFTFVAIVSIILILINRIWAKRTHLFFAALNLAYLIRTYILFTSCYNTICPIKQTGIYLLVASCILLMVICLFPDMKLSEAERNKTESDTATL